jgi:hypothetical protein
LQPVSESGSIKRFMVAGVLIAMDENLFNLLFLGLILCYCAYCVMHVRRCRRRLKACGRLLAQHTRRHPKQFVAECLFVLLVVLALLMPWPS